jgi:N-acetylglutamate synthase-like GNAT family acetyltransferase
MLHRACRLTLSVLCGLAGLAAWCGAAIVRLTNQPLGGVASVSVRPHCRSRSDGKCLVVHPEPVAAAAT